MSLQIDSNDAVHIPIEEGNTEDNIDGQSDEEDDDDHSATEQWMILSKLGPNRTVANIELGRREIDLDYDWHSNKSKYLENGTIDGIRDFIKSSKKEDVCRTYQACPKVTFNDEQKK